MCVRRKALVASIFHHDIILTLSTIDSFWKINLLFLQLAGLSLKELYCEQNNLLHHLPVQSVQDEEVLPLKVFSLYNNRI